MAKKGGVSGHTHNKQQLDNYANQHNPNNRACWANHNNHSNQCNPNNSRYIAKHILSKTEYTYESCQPDD